MKENDVEITGKVKNAKPVEPSEPTNENDRISQLEKQIAILRDSVRQDRLSQADDKMNGKKERLPVGHLKKLNGKLVVKWLGAEEAGSQAKQELIYQNNNVVGEKLIGHYITIDGEDIVCDAINFTRSIDIEKFTKIGGTQKDWIIEFHNPVLATKYPAYKIDVKYLNP
jgi:hypothetical protein